MSLYKTAVAVAALSLAALASSELARAADVLVKAAEKAPDLPFFLVIDDRVSVSWIPNATSPGSYSIKPGGGIDSTTAKQVYSFTHFDAWQYGTNFLNISLFKSDHNDPANPCTNAGVIFNPGTRTSSPANCEGASEIYGSFRSTFGWNEIFGTKAFTTGPLHNISFEVGLDGQADNHYLAAAKRAVVAGLQLQFDLPYKGYFNLAPLMYWNFAGRNAFTQCGNGFSGAVAFPAPGATCLIDGNRSYDPTWAVETNYYMDLGFLPESMQFWSISGRAAWYGKKGNENNPLPGTSTAVELNSEPIRLTFDASKAVWGKKHSHSVDVWVAYRYWQNKYGLDAANSKTCNVTPGVSNNTSTESSIYTGVTVKF
jgi:hypothetical protein